MIRSFGVALIVVLVTACSSSGDDASPVDSLPDMSIAATSSAGASAALFRGQVTNVNSGCAVDAVCSIDVIVEELIDGTGPEVGETIRIIEAYGFGPIRCYSRWDSVAVGDEVLVSAEWTGDGEASICPSTEYFVERIGPSPAPTPCSTLISPSGSAPTLAPCASNEPTLAPPTPPSR